MAAPILPWDHRSGVLKSKGVFKRLAASGAGFKNSSRGSLRTSKENPPELWSPATWDSDRDAWLLPPRQRGAQLEGWKQQPFVPACYILLILLHIGWEIRINRTTPSLTPGGGGGDKASHIHSWACMCTPLIHKLRYLRKLFMQQSGTSKSIQKSFITKLHLLRTSHV